MISLVYASTASPSSREANAIQIDQMCRAFSQAGCTVVLTAAGYPPQDERPYRLAMLPWRYPRFRNRLMRVLARSVVHKHDADILYSRCPLLAHACIREGLSIILELHSLPRVQSQSRIALKRLLVHPSLRRVVAISQALADDLVAEYEVMPSSCDVIVAHDCAVLGSRPGPAPAPKGNVTVGYFGHLYPGKGMETIADLAKVLPNIHFEVYGGTDADLETWRARTAAQVNLCLNGYIAHSEVASLMARCDILIAPYSTQVSHAGGGDIGRWMSPLKLFEYMAAERPIVTSDLPVLREVLRHGETALLCQPGDTASFAEAISTLALDPVLRARLGSAGRELLEKAHTWEKRAQRILKDIEIS